MLDYVGDWQLSAVFRLLASAFRLLFTSLPIGTFFKKLSDFHFSLPKGDFKLVVDNDNIKLINVGKFVFCFGNPLLNHFKAIG